MTARRLLQLYPRAWRERYGDELLDVAGHEALQLQQIIDIAAGAIDAWLSAEVRRAVPEEHSGGTAVMKAFSICSSTETRYTKRDGLIGGAVMLAGSLVSVAIGTALKRNGFDSAAEAVFSMGWLVSMNLSMPLWLTKGQPVKAQLAITGVTTAILVFLAWLNA